MPLRFQAGSFLGDPWTIPAANCRLYSRLALTSHTAYKAMDSGNTPYGTTQRANAHSDLSADLWTGMATRTIRSGLSAPTSTTSPLQDGITPAPPTRRSKGMMIGLT